MQTQEEDRRHDRHAHRREVHQRPDLTPSRQSNAATGATSTNVGGGTADRGSREPMVARPPDRPRSTRPHPGAAPRTDSHRTATHGRTRRSHGNRPRPRASRAAARGTGTPPSRSGTRPPRPPTARPRDAPRSEPDRVPTSVHPARSDHRRRKHRRDRRHPALTTSATNGRIPSHAPIHRPRAGRTYHQPDDQPGDRRPGRSRSKWMIVDGFAGYVTRRGLVSEGRPSSGQESIASRGSTGRHDSAPSRRVASLVSATSVGPSGS